MHDGSSLQKRRVRTLTKVNDDGSAELRIRIPRALWETAVAFGLKMEIKPDKALRFIFDELAGMIAQGNVNFFGQTLREAVQKARDSNFGVLSDAPKIELDKLHKSKKTKSGYVGVYHNGNGFRAMGRESKESTKQIYLGQFETSEAAAWHRYLHYKTNKMPYGELEEEIERYRTQFNDERSEEEIIADIKQDAINFGFVDFLKRYFPEDANAKDLGKYTKEPGT